MEQGIILEGINAMLEEIRDNMKKNPEQEMINSKLSAIEKICNDFAEKKLVTEDLMADFIRYVLKQMIEMDKKQDEKIEKLKGYILGHHKYVKEHVYELQKNVIVSLEPIYELLNRRQKRMNLFEKIFKALIYR